MEVQPQIREENSKHLQIAIISDIHFSFQAIENFRKHIVDNNISIDFLIILGDIINNINNEPHENEEEYERKGEQKLLEVFKAFEFLTIPILWVPGEHDPKGSFKNSIEFNSLFQEGKIINLHKRSFDINQDLQIIGFGGTIPSMQDIGQSDLDQVYYGFPYKDENQFSTDFQPFIQQNTSAKDKQTILITHMGPYTSSTSIEFIYGTDAPIYTGSQAIDQSIQDINNNIIGNFHGHNHSNPSFTFVDKQFVCNPGVLGNAFCFVEFSKSTQWNVESFKMVKLSKEFE